MCREMMISRTIQVPLFHRAEDTSLSEIDIPCSPEVPTLRMVVSEATKPVPIGSQLVLLLGLLEYNLPMT